MYLSLHSICQSLPIYLSLYFALLVLFCVLVQLRMDMKVAFGEVKDHLKRLFPVKPAVKYH